MRTPDVGRLVAEPFSLRPPPMPSRIRARTDTGDGAPGPAEVVWEARFGSCDQGECGSGGSRVARQVNAGSPLCGAALPRAGHPRDGHVSAAVASGVTTVRPLPGRARGTAMPVRQSVQSCTGIGCPALAPSKQPHPCNVTLFAGLRRSPRHPQMAVLWPGSQTSKDPATATLRWMPRRMTTASADAWLAGPRRSSSMETAREPALGKTTCLSSSCGKDLGQVTIPTRGTRQLHVAGSAVPPERPPDPRPASAPSAQAVPRWIWP